MPQNNENIFNQEFPDSQGLFKEQLSIEAQWTQYFTDAVGHIQNSLTKENILKTSVEEVRRVLACDRVVVYSVDKYSQGIVIAESVAAGWVKAIGMTIQDPCFEARYIEKYQNGRVRAIENIYDANLTPCYIEQLEKLGVKANLVAPVLNEGKLLGLLVAHQCSQPRQWQQHEIRWFSQIAMQVGFALDNATFSTQVSHFRQQADIEAEWTKYFTDTVRYIRASLKEEDILETATEEVRRVLGCDRVVIYGLNTESMGVIIAESVAAGWVKAIGRTIKDPCFEARYIEQYQDGRVRASDNIYDANLTPCYIEQLEKLGVKANLVAPVLNEGKLLGLLVAHQCSQPRQWQQHEIRWFSQIAMQVGFALDNAKLLEENALAYQTIENISQQQSQQEEFQQLLTELLKGSEISFKAFSTKAHHISESLAVALNQIQEVASVAKNMELTAEQAEYQVQRNNQILQEGQETIRDTIHKLSVLQQAVTDGMNKVRQMSEYCKKLSDLTYFVCDVAKQMNSQRKVENDEQEYVMSNTEEVDAQTKLLVKVIVEEIQPLITSMLTGTNQMVETMETGSEQVLAGAQSLEATQQKLYRIASVSVQVTKLVEKIAQAAANQAQNSNNATLHMLSANDLAHQTVEQSQAMTTSFNHMMKVAQEDSQKSGFWENLKRSLLSSRTLIAIFAQRK
ncbi:MAG: GAF domain-containing protein [Fischerella sp. CENA71]|nr:GAF domain-containing protein [Fischerella sp. CENA71]